MVTLSYMPTEHVPVLAAEVIRDAAPQPGRPSSTARSAVAAHSCRSPNGIRPAVPSHRPRSVRGVEQIAGLETRFVNSDFADALAELAAEGVHPDVILFDLGVSSMQIDAWERGFSYSFDAPLDMRMDPDSELTAAEVVNDWPESRIAEILRNFADERHARSIAREIVAARPLETTSELVDAVRAGVPPRSASVAATRPSAPSRPSASPSTRSSANSTPRCRRPRTCSRPAAACAGDLLSTRWRTAASSGSSPSALAGASARLNFPSRSAGSSPGRADHPRRRRPERG